MANSVEKNHQWRFCRLGGFDQVIIDSGEDVRNLHALDPKLWAALSCPVTGLEIAPGLLKRLDLDRDDRVRVDEIIAAADWASRLLKDPQLLFEQTSKQGLPLTEIDDSTADGQLLIASAKQILAARGRSNATLVTPEDTADADALISNSKFNVDGVITSSMVENDELAKAVADIAVCIPALDGDKELAGVNQTTLEQFFATAEDYLSWYAEAAAHPEKLLPLGDDTEVGAAVIARVKGKIEDYFSRVRLADFDPHAAQYLNPAEEDYRTLATEVLSPTTTELAALPLAHIVPGRPLPLSEGINPAWSEAITSLRQQVIAPLLGNIDALTEAQWLDLSARFTAHAEWLASQRGREVAVLGPSRVRALLESDVRQRIEALLAKNDEMRATADALGSVDCLVHLYLYLAELLNNFVNLRDFYMPEHKAVFQAGTLYVDGRSCDLCIRVEDVEKHAALANLSNMYLAYCQCVRRGGEETITIVAAVTSGDSRNLMVGRNGVFSDRKGQNWDATIVKLLENPISISQAFWSPYYRAGRFISEQFEKFAASKDDVLSKKLMETAEKPPAQPAEAAKPAAFDVARFAGIFAAIGLALGALGTAVASILTGLLNLSIWQLPLVLVGIVLIISGPSMFLAYLKLRSRNLAPLLDASGWAVNGHALINIPFGRTLTDRAKLPVGAKLKRRDPFASRKTGSITMIVLILIIAILGFVWWYADLGDLLTQFKAFLESASQQNAK